MKRLPSLFAVFALTLLVTATPVVLPAQSTSDELINCVQRSDFETLAVLLIEGADVNETTKFGFTPLMAASKIGDRLIVGVLLSHNPDVNKQNNAGATALMIAAKYGHMHVVKQLLENGADPLIKNNNGITASRFAYAYNHREVYEMLGLAEKNYGKS